MIFQSMWPYDSKFDPHHVQLMYYKIVQLKSQYLTSIYTNMTSNEMIFLD